MPLFRRPDGDLVRGESPLRAILPYVMRGRNESVIYHEAHYDIARTRAFLRGWNHAHDREQPATLFHLFMWLCARALEDRPGLNRFVSGGRLYQRKKTFISFAAKKALNDESPLVTVKMEVKKGEPFSEFVKRIVSAIGDKRTGPADSLEKELKLAMMLPGPVLAAVMAVLRWLDRVNLMPGFMIENDPLYTSLFVSNLGSVGLDRVYHHLYESGTAAMFASLGAPRKQLMPDRAGNPVTKDILEVRWTLDERVNDGLYCARGLAQLKKMFEDPAPWVEAAGAAALASEPAAVRALSD
jgi:hypothetical protein